MTREQAKRQYLEDENLRKLAHQIMASRNAEQILAALQAVLPPKEETVKPNIQRLTDYINQQEDPERFMGALFACCRPTDEPYRRGEQFQNDC